MTRKPPPQYLGESEIVAHYEKKKNEKSNKGNKEPAYHLILILILHLTLYGG